MRCRGRPLAPERQGLHSPARVAAGDGPGPEVGDGQEAQQAARRRTHRRALEPSAPSESAQPMPGHPHRRQRAERGQYERNIGDEEGQHAAQKTQFVQSRPAIPVGTQLQGQDQGSRAVGQQDDPHRHPRDGPPDRLAPSPDAPQCTPKARTNRKTAAYRSGVLHRSIAHTPESISTLEQNLTCQRSARLPPDRKMMPNIPAMARIAAAAHHKRDLADMKRQPIVPSADQQRGISS